MPIVAGPGDPGTTLDLCAVFLNVAADPGDFLAIEYVGESLSPTTTGRVEVRQLANRRRLIRTGNTDGVTSYETYAVTFPRCDSTEVEWLRAHVGVLVCIRDHKGGKFYGVYVDAPREISTKFEDRTMVRITVDEVTHSEVV